MYIYSIFPKNKHLSTSSHHSIMSDLNNFKYLFFCLTPPPKKSVSGNIKKYILYRRKTVISYIITHLTIFPELRKSGIGP